MDAALCDRDLGRLLHAAIKITAPAYGLTEMIGVVVTVAIHLWRRNPVLSIVTGTAAV